MLSMLRRKLESLKDKEVLSQGELIDSIKKPQKGIDTLKDKASSRRRVVTFGVSPSTTSEVRILSTYKVTLICIYRIHLN